MPSMPDGPIWRGDTPELMSMMNAIRRNYGQCTCHVARNGYTGREASVHMCAAHVFLSERDEPGRYVEWTIPSLRGSGHWREGSLGTCIERVDRLLFARRMRGAWLVGEFVVQGYPSLPDAPNYPGLQRPISSGGGVFEW